MATYTPATRGSFFVDINFDDGTRLLKGANIFFEDDSNNLNTEMDSVTLVIKDVDGNTQETLTEISVPPITLETPANVYVVSEIDVTGYPDGYISLNWTGEKDGYEYTYTTSVANNTAPDMVFVPGTTDSLEDHTVVLDEAKVFTVRLRDSLNTPIVASAARVVFYDTLNGSIIETASGTLVSAGSGLYRATVTLATGNYSPTIDRYQVYWEAKATGADTFQEVTNSRYWLKVYGATNNISTGPLTYTTNEFIRKTFPDIDSLLSKLNPNQSEREILLSNKRLEASYIIQAQVKHARIKTNRELLNVWEAYEAYRLILISGHSFAKFAVQDGQMEAITNQIRRIRAAIFSPVQTIRIGGRTPLHG